MIKLLNHLIRYATGHKYALVTGLHIVLGVVLYRNPEDGSVLGWLLLIAGILWIVKTKNNNQQVLFAVAYVSGAEVLLRMLGATGYEFGKYTILIFALVGILYNGYSKKAWWYVLYLALLAPSLLLADDLLATSRSDLKLIVLNVSGPICLGFLSIYTFEKRIGFALLSRVLLAAALPTLTIATLVFLRSPEINSIIIANSNPAFSGSFGPNQVATVLGMGMFVFFYRAVLHSGTTRLAAINLLFGCFLAYIGLLTFSRGGMITGICVVMAMLALLYLKSETYGRARAKWGTMAFATCIVSVFALLSYQTDGLLVKRYTNRDHLGRFKGPREGDRSSLAVKEVKLFIENPLVGAGVIAAEHTRQSSFGKKYHSHGEITRMLAEHGLLGALAVAILLLIPAWLFASRRQHLFVGMLGVFWLLTINHSGMRLVAPAFLYALLLLQIDFRHASVFWRVKVPKPSPQPNQAQTVLNSI